MSSGLAKPRGAGRRWLLIALAFTALVALGTGVWYFDLAASLQPERIASWLRDAGPLGPLVLMALMITAVVIGPIPTLPISITAGAVFGPWLGFGYAMAGALLGAALSFLIARAVGREVVGRWVGGHVMLCEHCSNRLLFGVVLGARLVPVISFAAVSYGAGLTAMSPGMFMLATAIGMIPMTWLYVAVGTSLTVSPLWAGIGGVVLIAALLILPRIADRLRSERPADRE